MMHSDVPALLTPLNGNHKYPVSADYLTMRFLPLCTQLRKIQTRTHCAISHMHFYCTSNQREYAVPCSKTTMWRYLILSKLKHFLIKFKYLL